MVKKLITLIFLLALTHSLTAQVKILFDATKAETAGSADWVIDEDANNLGWTPGPVVGGGSEGNAQRIPTPAQSGITSSTTETFWKGAISNWGIDCVKQGYTVESLPYNGQITYGVGTNAQDLSNYKIFAVCEPNILFSASEKTAIMNFIQNGGSLFMISDHNGSDRNSDGYDSPHIWNDFMTSNGIQANPFGITYDLVDISPNTTIFPNLPGDPLLHGIMGDVTDVLWSDGTTMTISPTINNSVKGVVYNNNGTSGNTNVMVAYAIYGSGKVVAFGDSSPFDDGTGDSGDQLYNGYITDAGGNHRKLIMNATIWLASSSGPVPTVTTTAASSLSFATATLNGTVNPNGVSTTYDFNWGTTTGYGTSTTITSAGSGSSALPVSANLTGLASGTTYHFRLGATNSNGTANGNDLTFTTLSPTLSVTPSNQNVTSAGATTTFTVTSNSPWIALSNQEWCTVTPSGLENGTITATFSLNSTIIQRVATVTVTVTGLTPVVVTVTQAAAAPILSVTPSNQNVSVAASSTSFTVSSNSPWTVSSDQSWCVPTASGSGNGTITVNYTLNPLSDSRTANLTVTVSGVTPDIVTVNQAGSGTSALPEPTNFPSQFSAYTIHIQWTDAIGTFVPEGYLIRMSSIGFEDISNPVDGVPVTDGPNSKNIPAGIQQAWFGNLNPATHYYFKIYGYSGSWNSINYKTDGTIPQVEATTEP